RGTRTRTGKRLRRRTRERLRTRAPLGERRGRGEEKRCEDRGDKVRAHAWSIHRNGSGGLFHAPPKPTPSTARRRSRSGDDQVSAEHAVVVSAVQPTMWSSARTPAKAT